MPVSDMSEGDLRLAVMHLRAKLETAEENGSRQLEATHQESRHRNAGWAEVDRLVKHLHAIAHFATKGAQPPEPPVEDDECDCNMSPVGHSPFCFKVSRK